MFVSDEALLDVSFTVAQARLSTSCWFTNVRACAGIGFHRHVDRRRASTVTLDMLQTARVAGQVDTAQPGALLLPDVSSRQASSAMAAETVVPAAVTGKVPACNPANLAHAVHVPCSGRPARAWAEPGG